MSLSGEYATGKVSIAHGDTTVTLTGGVTSSLVSGDPFFAANAIGLIASITDATHFELRLPWAGETVELGDFVVPYLSTQRYQGAFNGAKVRELLSLLDGIGVIYYVPIDQDAPDPTLQKDGDYAIKIVPGSAWSFWVKQGGVWVALGAPLGISISDEFWSAETDYTANVIVSDLGVVYVSKRANTNKRPATNPNDWKVLLAPGARCEITISAEGKVGSSEKLYPYVAATDLFFQAGLEESIGTCQSPANATTVLTLVKTTAAGASSTVGTVTYAAGNKVPVITSSSDITLARGDTLTPVGPASEDDGLRYISLTLVGYRR